MKTLLVFPPAADPAHPPLGIASLAAYLRTRHENVELLDLNVGAYHRLLSSDNLRRCARRMESRIAELEAVSSLAAAEAEEYRLLAENLLSASYLQAEIDGALEDLRRPATYESRARYARVSALLRRAMELVSAAHYPVRWYPRGFSMSWLPTRSRDVLRATRDRRQNLFLPLIEEGLARWDDEPPDVVGVSVNYYCQVIPGMTVAAVARRRFPRARLVVGGGLLCFFDGRWVDLAPFRRLVDFWVPWEGEVPLGDLLACLGRGEDVTDVSGVLRFEADEAVISELAPPPDPRLLPPPSFDGLPLDKYLAPELVLPMLSSRGCYWTRCAFCSHYHLFRRRFRMKPADQVRGEMDHLADRYGCHTFYLSDEAIPPRIARALAAPEDGATRPEGRSYRWFGESRFERALDAETLRALAEGGCRMLMFGLESAVPRVLTRMDKGIDPAWAEQVLHGCAAHGIRTFVMFFIGFPGETRREAEETLRFVEALRGPITHVAFSNFVLEHQSPVYRQPERFGISEILPYADEDLKIYSEYRVGEGLSSEEAIAVLEEARERPDLRALIELYLVSRTHLVFLPPLAAAATEQTEERSATAVPPALGGVAEERLFPLRASDLVPCSLAFNLEEIRSRLAQRAEIGTDTVAAPPIGRQPTHYVFSPGCEKLLEVGDDGLRLLAPCDGRFSLGDILAAMGGADRDLARDFYAQLAERGMLRWEVRS